MNTMQVIDESARERDTVSASLFVAANPAPTKEEIEIALIERIVTLKLEEAAIAEARAEREARLCELVGLRDEGSATHKIGRWKVTLTARVNRTLDVKAWKEIEAQVPESLRPVKSKLVLDETGVKWLRDHEPSVYEIVARAITSRPGKPGVEIKPATEG